MRGDLDRVDIRVLGVQRLTYLGSASMRSVVAGEEPPGYPGRLDMTLAQAALLGLALTVLTKDIDIKGQIGQSWG